MLMSPMRRTDVGIFGARASPCLSVARRSLTRAAARRCKDRHLSSGFGLGRRSASERDGSLAAAVAAEAQQHASGAQLLEARLARLGFGLAVMKDDGNCQFRALSHQLFGTQAHHKEVRAEAVAHIRANEEVFAPFFTGGEMVRYLAAMGRDRTWGDELTLRAVCDSFGVVLYIVQSTQENWLLTYEPEGRSSKRRSSKRLFLTYLSPVHYNAITLPDGS